MEAVDALETGPVLHRPSVFVFSSIPFIRSSSSLLSTFPLKDEGQPELNIRFQSVPHSEHRIGYKNQSVNSAQKTELRNVEDGGT